MTPADDRPELSLRSAHRAAVLLQRLEECIPDLSFEQREWALCTIERFMCEEENHTNEAWHAMDGGADILIDCQQAKIKDLEREIERLRGKQ